MADIVSQIHTSNQLKKVIGKIILKINTEILELLALYKNVKEETPLTVRGAKLEEEILMKKEKLAEILKNLEKKPDYIIKENLERTVKMLKTNIETAGAILESKGRYCTKS